MLVLSNSFLAFAIVAFSIAVVLTDLNVLGGNVVVRLWIYFFLTLGFDCVCYVYTGPKFTDIVAEDSELSNYIVLSDE